LGLVIAGLWGTNQELFGWTITFDPTIRAFDGDDRGYDVDVGVIRRERLSS
jgi:hypothetical protein